MYPEREREHIKHLVSTAFIPLDLSVHPKWPVLGDTHEYLWGDRLHAWHHHCEWGYSMTLCPRHGGWGLWGESVSSGACRASVWPVHSGAYLSQSEERAHKTSRFSFTTYMTINQFLGNQSNTQPTFKSLSAIEQYLKLKAFFFQRLPPGRLEKRSLSVSVLLWLSGNLIAL